MFILGFLAIPILLVDGGTTEQVATAESIRNAFREATQRQYERYLKPPFMGGRKKRADVFPEGYLMLESVLKATANSNLYVSRVEPFESEGSTARQVVVKYTSDCSDRLMGMLTTHPLVWEYTVQAALNSTGISPEVYYLSPAGQYSFYLPNEASSRSTPNFVQKRSRDCERVQSEVRFLVMQQVGVSVSTYLQWVKSNNITGFAASVLKVSIKVVRLLKRLHTLGIVHGDIHSGNIAFREIADDMASIDLDNAELVLIDFAFAKFFPGNRESPPWTHVRHPGLRPSLLSPWQLQHLPAAPKDDIFRLLEMMARALSHGNLNAGFDRLIEDRFNADGRPAKGSPLYLQLEDTELIYSKLNDVFFGESDRLQSSCFRDMAITPDTVDMVQRKLDSIMEGFRKYAIHEHQKEEFEYDALVSDLEQALDFVIIH